MTDVKFMGRDINGWTRVINAGAPIGWVRRSDPAGNGWVARSRNRAVFRHGFSSRDLAAEWLLRCTPKQEG